MNKKLWWLLFFALLIILSADAVKIHLGINIRIGQIFLLLVFGIILLWDLIQKSINISLLIFFISFAFLMTLISINSIYPKIDEFKFIIKYFLLFPAAFYVGSKIIVILNLKSFLKLIEVYLFIEIILAIILYFYPIETVIHNRGVNEFKGTFWEPMGLAHALILIGLISISLRFEMNYWSRKVYIYIFYALILIAALWTRSKTFWLGIFISYFTLLTYKGFINIKNYLYLGKLKFINIYNLKDLLKSLRLLYLIPILISFAFIFYFYNESLDYPIISKQIIQYKWEAERGAAFRHTLLLLQNSNWFGGYGWGFVESYFTNHNIPIHGLGEGNNALFSSLLDAWLTVGLFGLFFQLLLLKMAFSTKHLLTILIPTFFLIDGFINNTYGNEFYYFYLGICYGFKKYI